MSLVWIRDTGSSVFEDSAISYDVAETARIIWYGQSRFGINFAIIPFAA